MIEPTDEMIADAEREYGGNVQGDMIGAIKAVLAIVERDYRISPRPAWTSRETGIREHCSQPDDCYAQNHRHNLTGDGATP